MTDINKENDKLYKESIEAKSEAMLSIIGKKFLEQREAEIEQNESEADSFTISDETHEKILKMIKTEKQSAAKARRKRNIRKYAKISAMVLLVLSISGAVLVNNVEAFRYHFNRFWVEVKTEYLKLSPEDEEAEQITDIGQIPNGAWYPAYIPKGYEFSEFNDLGSLKEMFFVNLEKKTFSITESEAKGGSLYLDNESEYNGTVRISDLYDGYWTQNGSRINLVWLQSDMEKQAQRSRY